jgi:hypothetical protein
MSPPRSCQHLSMQGLTHPPTPSKKLKIMESLGGDQLWIDRFMAQHAAILYYWVLVGLFAFSPKVG